LDKNTSPILEEYHCSVQTERKGYRMDEDAAFLRNVRFIGMIHAGFPSPADDYKERPLDLNDLVVPYPVSTYFMRVEFSVIDQCKLTTTIFLYYLAYSIVSETALVHVLSPLNLTNYAQAFLHSIKCGS